MDWNTLAMNSNISVWEKIKNNENDLKKTFIIYYYNMAKTNQTKSVVDTTPVESTPVVETKQKKIKTNKNS